jgi:cobalt-zinc-cadmium efflux system membrane fusion protein
MNSADAPTSGMPPSGIPSGPQLGSPTTRGRVFVQALVGALALVTTAVVAIVADRSITGRGAARSGHDEHGAEGHDDHGHGETSSSTRGAAERHDDHGHDEMGHDDHGAEKHPPPIEGLSEHRPHVDVATVTLTAAQRDNAKLELLKAAAGRVDEIMTLPGEVAFDADRVAHVTPRAEGAVREVRAALGAQVKKGDVLAVLDSREVAAMQQEAMATRARRELAEGNFRRIEPLFKDGITSEKEFLASKQALAEAKIDEASAAQKLAAGAGPRASAAGLPLIAPLDGTVVEKHVTIGEILAPNTQAFTIADLSRLWVWSTAHSRELGRVQQGQRAYIRSDGMDAPILGRVDYVEAMLGERTRTARARIVIETPAPGWRPGMFVTSELVVGEIDAPVVVREEAIQRLGDHPVIFVEEDGRFEARPVELGRAGRDAEGHLVRAVDAGLRAGEPYVARNAFILKAELGKGSAGHEH